MTDAELIARLRDLDTWVETADIPDLAADRIEALTAELNTCRMAQAVMDNTVAELEAKLAKAVEALDYCIKAPFSGWTIAQGYARATLAEIKGDAHG